MPVYSYECLTCTCEFEKTLKLSEFGSPQVCPECQGETKRRVPNVNFVLRGDGWPGKALKIRQQMAEKNKRLDAKSKDRSAGMTLAPNVDGEEVDTWAEAKKLASSKGKDTSSYEKFAAKEKEPK
jgi:putative FmdB family regulatory protein